MTSVKKSGFRPPPIKKANQLYITFAIVLGLLLVMTAVWAIYATAQALNQVFRIQEGPSADELSFQIQAAEGLKRLELVSLPSPSPVASPPSPSPATSSPSASPPVR